jgi:dTDP-glucose 4,6-dehydratase
MEKFLKLDLINQKVNFSEFKNQSFLITGGTGFFGKWLLSILAYVNIEYNLNIKIKVISREPRIFLEKFPEFSNSSIQFIKSNLQDLEIIKENFDYIIHAATTPLDDKFESKPILAFEEDVHATKKILEQSAYSKPKKFLLISSGAVYGMNNDTPRSEKNFSNTSLIDPKSIYTYGKLVSEFYTELYFREFGINYSIARCFAFVGPYLDLNSNYIIGNLIRNAIQNEDFLIKGDGLAYRSYLYMSDLVIWLLKILQDESKQEIYNVGSDFEISILELANKVKELTKSKNKILVLGKNKSTSIQKYIPDIQKIKSNLNVEVYTTLDEAILETYNYYLER